MDASNKEKDPPFLRGLLHEPQANQLQQFHVMILAYYGWYQIWFLLAWLE